MTALDEKVEKKLRQTRDSFARVQKFITQELTELNEMLGEEKLKPGKRRNVKADRKNKYRLMYADKFGSKVDEIIGPSK